MIKLISDGIEKQLEEEYITYKEDSDLLDEEYAHPSKKVVDRARMFVRKYKVLFAAVWENVVDDNIVQDFFLEAGFPCTK